MAGLLSTDVQVYVFLLIFSLGVVIGFFFDVCRAGRFLLKKIDRKPCQDVFDIVFLAIAAAVAVMGIVFLNWGELRLYVFLALLAGLLGYNWLASPFILDSLVATAVTCKQVLSFSWRIICYPLMPLRHPAKRFLRKGKGLGIRLSKAFGYYIKRICSLWKKLPGFLSLS